MTETQITDRLRELEGRIDALEALHAAPIPPMPEAPRRYREAVGLILTLVWLPAQTFGWTRVARWAGRLCVRVGQRGVYVAARRGTPAQRAHAARVFGGSDV
jgi:DNA transposition AAA+ family ATPase